MSTPKRIQRKRIKGWRMPEGTVYVGRGSMWGNPFRVVPVRPSGPFDIMDGDRFLGQHTDRSSAVRKVVELHNLHIGPMGAHELDAEDLDALRGRDLACWCPLDFPCHADVLIELANQ